MSNARDWLFEAASDGNVRWVHGFLSSGPIDHWGRAGCYDESDCEDYEDRHFDEDHNQGECQWQDDVMRAMVLAALKGHAALVDCILTHKYSLDKGWDLDWDTEKSKAFVFAAEKGHLAVVECMLSRDVDLRSEMYKGQTALAAAAGNGHLAVVDFLLNYSHEDKNEASEYEDEASECEDEASEYEDEASEEEDEASEEEEDAMEIYKVEALQRAAENGQLEVAEYLLQHGVDVNARTKETALIAAARGGHASLVQYLLWKGADANLVDRSGHTALIVARRNGHTAVVECLTAQSADIDLIDTHDETTLGIAAQSGHSSVADIQTDHQHGEVAVDETAKRARRDVSNGTADGGTVTKKFKPENQF